jgi:hypothetical protein
MPSPRGLSRCLALPQSQSHRPHRTCPDHAPGSAASVRGPAPDDGAVIAGPDRCSRVVPGAIQVRADRATAGRLRRDGDRPRVFPVRWPGYSDTPHGREGVRVRVGRYATPGAARAAADTLHDQGFPTATVEWTGYDADAVPDAEQIRAAIVGPGAFRLAVTHDGPVARRQTTTEVAAATGATVAVNGGFYIVSDDDGYQGVPTGLAVYQGRLESMSQGTRGALVLGDGPPRIEHLVSTVTIRAGSARHAIQGINRRPGVIEDCGRLGAVSALNLDGGGSTAMAIRAHLVNQPSDPAGERPDGDAVVAVPRRSS